MSKGKLTARENGWREAQRVATANKRKFEVEVNGKPLQLEPKDEVKVTFNHDYDPITAGKIPGNLSASPTYATSTPSWTYQTGNTAWLPLEQVDMKPDKETLGELLGLDEGEEVVSYAVRKSDGSIDVRVLDN